MQIRSSELEIPKEDPFKNDCLNRRDLEPPLTEFVNQALGPFVLAIDGSWGSGKTTFLKMWQVKLDGAGHLCLYLNAWKNDFVQDPLIAVVGELSIAIQEQAQDQLDKDNVRKTIEKIEKTARSIVRRLIPVGVKLATFGLLDIDSSMEREISATTGAIVENLIQGYDKGKSDIKTFREDLEFLANAIQLPDSKAVKIVIVIDELDRCRPTYAVQLLERIKHLFDVEGVVFILGIDRAQLGHSIKALYGSEFDATGYLKRFIDIDYRLPEPELGSYCSYLFKRFEIGSLLSRRTTSNPQYDLHDLKLYLGYLMSAAKMSLRDQEQIISRLRVVIQTIPIDQKLFPVTLSILLFLYSRNYSVYTSVGQGNLTCKKFMNLIEELPNEREAFQAFLKKERNYGGFFKERIQGVFLSGLREILDSDCPELQELKSTLNSDKGINLEREIVSIALQEAGFEITKERLNLTSNFRSIN
jgi:KAP family P-loop domain